MGNPRWLGYRSGLWPAERGEALRGCWRVENSERWVVGLLVATPRGLVVDVSELNGVKSAWQQLRPGAVTEPGRPTCNRSAISLGAPEGSGKHSTPCRLAHSRAAGVKPADPKIGRGDFVISGSSGDDR